MLQGDSQGDFNVTRLLDGSLRFTCPRFFVVAPPVGMQIVKAILDQLGVEVQFINPGQAVIRSHNGNGLLK